MNMNNIFSDKGIINIIPLFTAFYLAFYTKFILLPILLAISTLIFYISTAILAKKIIDTKNPNKENTNDFVLKELIKDEYKVINSFFSLCHWTLLIVTTIILYQYKYDFNIFILFWTLILGFIYNFISLFIFQGKIVKKEFSSSSTSPPH